MAENKDNNNITKLDATQIANAFNKLSEKRKSELSPFHPTLEKINGIIAKFHDAGVDHVGVEVATFDELRDLNLTGYGSSEHLHAILTAADAQFILRLNPDGKMDCCLENMNKARGYIVELEDEFWDPSKNTSIETYDINDDKDCLIFANILIDLAAECQAHQELKSFDLIAKQRQHMPKRGGFGNNFKS